MDICHECRNNVYSLIFLPNLRVYYIIFEKFQEGFSKGDDETTQRLQSLSVTRWTARGRAAKVLLDTIETLMKVLLDIHNDASINRLARSDVKKMENGLELFPHQRIG